MDLKCSFSASTLAGSRAPGRDTRDDVEASLVITLDPTDEPTHVVRELCVAEGLPADFTRSLAALVQDVVDDVSRAAPPPVSALPLSLPTVDAATGISGLHSVSSAGNGSTLTLTGAWIELLRAGRMPTVATAPAPSATPASYAETASSSSSAASAPGDSDATHRWATAYQAVIARRDLRGVLFACGSNLAAAARQLHASRAAAFAQLSREQAREMEDAMRAQVPYTHALTPTCRSSISTFVLKPSSVSPPLCS
jgi:hypothetical protein